MNATTYGLDVAKQIFQMYDAQTGEVANRRFRRDELIVLLAQRPSGRVALEACGSVHWWARKIKALGHEVVLLHTKSISKRGEPYLRTLLIPAFNRSSQQCLMRVMIDARGAFRQEFSSREL
ncbi:transposase, partial [Paraburkholderia sp. GAS334]